MNSFIEIKQISCIERGEIEINHVNIKQNEEKNLEIIKRTE